MVKIVKDVFSDPIRAAAAVTTFGGSEIANAVGGKAGEALGAGVNPIGAATNQALGIGGGGSTPKTSPTPVPSGPATQPDLTNFKKFRTSDSAAPEGVSFGTSLTSDQQRAQIATGGTAGNTGIYTTPEVARFYKDLAIRSLTDEGGNPVGNPLPVERQFMEQVFGVRPRDESTAAFLSALLRADGGYETPKGGFYGAMEGRSPVRGIFGQ